MIIAPCLDLALIIRLFFFPRYLIFFTLPHAKPIGPTVTTGPRFDCLYIGPVGAPYFFSVLCILMLALAYELL